MSLDKHRQTYLLKWLKQQATAFKTTIRASVLIGIMSTLLIIIQAALLAIILQDLIINKVPLTDILPFCFSLLFIFLLRALLVYYRQKINFKLGCKIRQQIRENIIDKLEALGPAYLKQNTIGSMTTLIVEQVENIQDYYANYLPQIRLAGIMPIMIFLAILPFNWSAAVILLCTAPLIPLFMILVGMGAADINRRNFKALAYLSGHFLDRLKGLNTIRLFNQGRQQTAQIHKASENFRIRTMQVLKLAFLSSAVLEFFSAISIAIVAVYFGFTYLGEFNFGSYNGVVTLFAGFFALILAPEFFQPLRDLGTFYHAKAEAIAAADNIDSFLAQTNMSETRFNQQPKLVLSEPLQSIEANELIVLSPDKNTIVGPLSFSIKAPFHLALIGTSGEGKTSLINVLLGFLPYQGSLKINGVEFNQLDITHWQQQISWLGQNPYLLPTTIRENILLGKPNATEDELQKIIKQADLTTMINALPNGLDTQVGEEAVRLSVGQAQRVSLARALLKPCQLLILDEPTASLDKDTIKNLDSIYSTRNSMTITHQNENMQHFTEIWQLNNGQLTKIMNRGKA